MQQKCSLKTLLFSNMWFTTIQSEITQKDSCRALTRSTANMCCVPSQQPLHSCLEFRVTHTSENMTTVYKSFVIADCAVAINSSLRTSDFSFKMAVIIPIWTRELTSRILIFVWVQLQCLWTQTNNKKHRLTCWYIGWFIGATCTITCHTRYTTTRSILCSLMLNDYRKFYYQKFFSFSFSIFTAPFSESNIYLCSIYTFNSAVIFAQILHLI